MKTRIISGLAALLILFAVLFVNKIVLGIAVFLLSLIGIYEFYNAVKNGGFKPLKAVGYLSCIPLLLFALNGESNIKNTVGFSGYISYLVLAFFIVIVLLFSFIIFLHGKYNITDIALTAFGMYYVPFLFSFITATRYIEGGFYYIWLIFIGAFVTDTSAYFTGRAFGKRKLLPAISPNKTVEGSIGGVAGCVVVTVLYGIFINSSHYVSYIPIYHFIILGIMTGVISQIGDWAASAIKRFVKIKDYGNIMPGHGGVLDRFDSILFVAPVVYFYITMIILNL